MSAVVLGSVAAAANRIEHDFNFGWQFHPGEVAGEGAPGGDTAAWRDLRLPHDWSVEASFDQNLEGATGYLPGGVGWYRKVFPTPAEIEHRRVVVYFDGIYNNAELWLNGKSLGTHPYGYSPFHFDLTELLNPAGTENVLTVRVDRTRYADSRWYTGSGIYRNVRLIETDRLRVVPDGVFVRAPEIHDDFAQVVARVEIANDRVARTSVQVAWRIVDPKGEVVASNKTEQDFAPATTATVVGELTLPNPERWDPDSPALYQLVTQLNIDGEVCDEVTTTFGLRTIRFDADKGFFLNDRPLRIKGVCLHHDGGLVGAAVPRDVWRRRLAMLKAGGCNAIRMAHNPSSRELLELCDEMGLLVQQEFFDEWDYPKDKRYNNIQRAQDDITDGYHRFFRKWAERDLKTTMRRDRNHPSIFQWSIGNEIEWTFPRYKHATGFFNMDWTGNYFWSKPPISPSEIKQRYDDMAGEEYPSGETARQLAAWTREMDTSRPVTANLILPSASHLSGYADALDVVGYSYRRVLYDYGHELYPERPIMGTENLGQWHEWKAVIEREHIAGIFIWTGIDYMGESHDQWPRKSTPSGLLDTAGFPKPSWHLYKTLWTEEPHLQLVTQLATESPYRTGDDGVVVEKEPGAWQQRTWFWHDVNEHWNYAPGSDVIVEVYSNCAEVELFLNGESWGVQRLVDQEDRAFKWAVPFAAGTLTARGRGGYGPAEVSRHTAAAPVAVRLKVDKAVLSANRYDVAHIVAHLVDADGHPVRTDDRRVDFALTGPVKLLGVDTGDPRNVQDYQADHITTHRGRALLVVQALAEAGVVTIRATAADLEPAVIKLTIE